MTVRSGNITLAGEADLDHSRWTTALENCLLVTLFSVVYVAVSVLVNRYVLPADIVNQQWVDAGMGEEVEAIASRRDAWHLYGYFATPMFVVIKIGFTAVCLAVGCALAEWEIPYAHLFRISAHAEIVWAVAAVVGLISVLFVVDIDSATDYAGFYPLSMLSLVDLQQGNLWAAYMLKTINVFEIAYAAMLTLELRASAKTSVSDAATLVIASYGTGTVLVVAALTFILMTLL